MAMADYNTQVWFTSLIAAVSTRQLACPRGLGVSALAVRMVGSRGPRRAAGSEVKIRCAYKRCRSKADVKNVGKRLQLEHHKLNPRACRTLRQHAVARFCCEAHRDKCMVAVPLKPHFPEGREALNHDQVRHLFQQLLADNCPWAAVLMTLQIFMAERADCARQCQWDWLQNLSPAAAGMPVVNIPSSVNLKTTERPIPLHAPFAHQLWRWATQEPLRAPDGHHQWPPLGHTLQGSAPMFPGLDPKGRISNIAVSERAYLQRLRSAAHHQAQSRTSARMLGNPHPFDDFDLSRLGTHSMKKTAVTLLKDAGVSTAIVSSVAGTTVATLDRVYDRPTPKRQRQAVSVGLGSLVDGGCAPAAPTPAAQFCTMCGNDRQSDGWAFCPSCGCKYVE